MRKYAILIMLLLMPVIAYASNCSITPTENCTINLSTVFNRSIYTLTDPEKNGVIKVNGSSLYINCNGSKIIGDKGINSIAFFLDNVSYVNISNCIIYNFTYGIYVTTLDSVLNFSFVNNTFASVTYYYAFNGNISNITIQPDQDTISINMNNTNNINITYKGLLAPYNDIKNMTSNRLLKMDAVNYNMMLGFDDVISTNDYAVHYTSEDLSPNPLLTDNILKFAGILGFLLVLYPIYDIFSLYKKKKYHLIPNRILTYSIAILMVLLVMFMLSILVSIMM